MIKIIKLLQRINPYLFIFYGVILSIAISMLLGYFSDKISSHNFVYDYNNYLMFVIAVVFTPLVETFIFQALPYFVINRYFKHKNKFWIYLFVSAIIFIHYNSFLYAVVTFLIGFVFAFFYYIAILKKESAYLLVVIIHSILNLISAIAHIH